MWPSPSIANSTGGLLTFSLAGDVSSLQRVWKIGQAMSGSLAPRSARRSSEMLDWIGKERLCFWERERVLRRGRLARTVRARREEMYVGWAYLVGVVLGMGA